MQPERLVCPLRLACPALGPLGTLSRKTTTLSQRVKRLLDDVLLGFVESHEDAADPVFFLIKPTTFSSAYQLCRGVNAQRYQGHLQPKQLTRRSVDFTGELQHKAAKADVEQDGAVYFEGKVLKFAQLDQSMGGVALSSDLGMFCLVG